ncbi:Sdc1 protein [Maudiozyma humilis]|uniref:Sdc1 protein n=1 Tax=Maudiozyma humilis TaxID=51915 RepID=A0AAV5S042_MAUHU|nr:Sdc1 protein [Kazachstania humilis]
MSSEVKSESGVKEEVPVGAGGAAPEASALLANVVGGSQVRRYLNLQVTPSLLAGMRLVAAEQPEDPLRVLGEFLIKESERIKAEAEKQ